MTTPLSHPHRGFATAQEVGRACPYCRFPLEPNVEIMTCGACAAAHHADCWAENHGCAVVACAGGPGSNGHAPPPPPPSKPPVPPLKVAPSPPRRSIPWLALAVVALALAVGGVAVALATGGGGGEETVIAPPAPTSDPGAVAGGAGEIQPTATPAVSGAEMATDMHAVLLAHHEAIVDRDFAEAWALLSTRKQAQNERKYGYDEWAANQATLSPYLDPSGLVVEIEDLDRRYGVARVRLTGMTWSKPGAPCSSWSGITWMKYEDGEWRYDPGYSTTPQRERDWKPRFDELLGGSC